MIIGFTGNAGSGKDTAADYVARKIGATKLAFADKVREMLAIEDGIVGIEDGQLVRYSEAVGKYGYDRAKRKYPEIRRKMNAIATEIVRNTIDEDYFVNDTMLRANGSADYVISDARFDNEKAAVQQRGVVIRVIRDDNEILNYESENLTDNHIDFTVYNNGTIEDLWRSLDIVLDEVFSSVL